MILSSFCFFLLARHPVAKWFLFRHFAPAQVYLFYPSLKCEFQRQKLCPFVRSITKWLLHTIPTAAPTIHFVMNGRILHFYWTHHRTVWSDFTFVYVGVEGFFDISIILNIEMGNIPFRIWYIRIGWLFHPRLCCNIF